MPRTEVPERLYSKYCQCPAFVNPSVGTCESRLNRPQITMVEHRLSEKSGSCGVVCTGGMGDTRPDTGKVERFSNRAILYRETSRLQGNKRLPNAISVRNRLRFHKPNR